MADKCSIHIDAVKGKDTIPVIEMEDDESFASLTLHKALCICADCKADALLVRMTDEAGETLYNARVEFLAHN